MRAPFGRTRRRFDWIVGNGTLEPKPAEAGPRQRELPCELDSPNKSGISDEAASRWLYIPVASARGAALIRR